MRKSSAAALKLSLVSLAVVLAAVGCSSGDSGTNGDGSGADSSADAMTIDEKALGATWDGQEADDITEADLAIASSPDGSDGTTSTASVAPSLEPDDGIHPLSTCTRTTGFNHGTQMSICTVTIDGKAVEQGTATAYERMRSAASQAGVHLVVVSGFRTMQKQRELYALYKAHRGNLAAPPGYSNHQSGHALDLNTKAAGVNSWLVKHAAAFGFRRTVPSENWHYEKW
ncbi:MAG: D-alanyl-D-alanine carboxypeptidase [Myxococcaceae bacterium]|nr:D-alanyl-D-alanine carboxypeptidase [Myxococcaceae bacterium]